MINISISSNLLIITSTIILIAIIGLIVYIIYKDKMIDQEEIDDLIDDIVKAKPRDDKEKNIESIKVTQIESNEPTKLNLEEMLNDMQNNLEKKKQKSIEEYEKEQDDNAIISIKDLQNSNVKSIDDYEKEQEDAAIININELKKFNSMDALTEKEEELVKPVKKAIAKIETNNNKSKFKSTDFISPIFGKMDNKIEYPKIKSYDKLAEEELMKAKHASLEQSIDVEPLSDEIKRNTEFLKALKEFRNNL
ncbi:MAG: hypothetical protein IJ715_04735 [Bacilli bacterium]|nr:hypothetical protein [Bacilli bacterium]